MLAGSWLFARVGDHHLIALDLAPARSAWVLGSHGRPRFDPFPVPRRSAVRAALRRRPARLLIVQLSDGRRWTIAPTPARVTASARRADGAGARGTARRREIADGSGSRSATAPGLVAAARPRRPAGRQWAVDAGGDASLTGDPPQVRAWGDGAGRRRPAEPRRRDGPRSTADGRCCGPTAAGVPRRRPRSTCRPPTPTRTTCTSRPSGVLIALDLADGKPAWEAELPGRTVRGGWVVRPGRSVVVAYPRGRGPGRAVGRRAGPRSCGRGCGPVAGWRLPGLAAALYDAWADRDRAGAAVRPGDGQARCGGSTSRRAGPARDRLPRPGPRRRGDRRPGVLVE